MNDDVGTAKLDVDEVYLDNQRFRMLESFQRSNNSSGRCSAREYTRHAPLFVDVDEQKRQIQAALAKPVYDVSTFYKYTGFWRTLATNPIFENLTLFVISVNAIWIAIDTDNNHASVLTEAEPIFQVAEHLFCAYFSAEWLVRFLAFRKCAFCLRDFWFVFDTLLVFMMVTETWVLTIVFAIVGGSGGGVLGNAAMLRLLRLLRLSRLARMLRSMPELMILVKGMVAAGRSVLYTLSLLLTMIYVFAIALKQLTKGSLPGKIFFPSILTSMHTLLLHGTFLDNLEVVCAILGGIQRPSDPALKAGSPHILVVFFMFVAIAALMVMNMLIGVLCEVVSGVAAVEQEEVLVAFVRTNMESILGDLDVNSDGIISKLEFANILNSQKAILVLNEVGVDPVGLVELSDFIFEDCDGNETELTFADFMSVILDTRRSKVATVKDMMNLTKFARTELRKLEKRMCGAIPIRRKTVQTCMDSFPVEWSKTHKGGGMESCKHDVSSDMFNPGIIQEITRAASTRSTNRDGIVASAASRRFNRPKTFCSPRSDALATNSTEASRPRTPVLLPKPRIEVVEALLMAARAELQNRDSLDKWSSCLAANLSSGLDELDRIRSLMRHV